MKAYWTNGKQTIYHGDMRAMPFSLPRFDLIVADPPYGETAFAWDEWPDGWVGLARNRLKSAGSLWCFGSMRMFTDHWNEFRILKLAQDAVWEKHNGSNSMTDRLRRVHELMLHFYQGEWKRVFKRAVYTPDAKRRRVHRQKKPAHWNGIEPSVYQSEVDGNRLLRSVIYARSCHGHAVNPTQKPVEIICPLIEHSCPPRGVILDAFMGSGSVLVAAKLLGRRAMGFDTRECQCEQAAKRLEAIR